jgi:hypothetical protein
MYVADQDASLEFYVDQLGFTKQIDEEMWPGARWVEVLPPSGHHLARRQFAINAIDSVTNLPNTEARWKAHPCLFVHQIDADTNP